MINKPTTYECNSCMTELHSFHIIEKNIRSSYNFPEN